MTAAESASLTSSTSEISPAACAVDFASLDAAATVRAELAQLGALLGDAELAAAAQAGDYTVLGRLAFRTPPAFREQIVANFQQLLGLGVDSRATFAAAAAFVEGKGVFEKEKYRVALASLTALVTAPYGSVICLAALDFTRVAALRRANPLLAPTIEALVRFALEEADDRTLEKIVEMGTGITRA